MASSATIISLVEQLALSLTTQPASALDGRLKRSINNMNRRLVRHNYARTNQFAVRDRLDGLEEKFHILNRDDLADKLWNLRIELNHCHEGWLPDVLDLLLQLSDDPVQKADITDLGDKQISVKHDKPLRWAEFDDAGMFDADDPVWQIPEYSDISSEDGEPGLSSTTTSPASVKSKQAKRQHSKQQQATSFEVVDALNAKLELEALVVDQEKSSGRITEIHIIRHILLIVQGYPSTLFKCRDDKLFLEPGVDLQGVSNKCLQAAVMQVNSIRLDLQLVKTWTTQESSVSHVQVMKQEIENRVQDFVSGICTIEEGLLHPESVQVVSLASILIRIQSMARQLEVLAKFIREVPSADHVGYLDHLFDQACKYYFMDNAIGFATILPIFAKALANYLQLVDRWLEIGTVSRTGDSFFIQRQSTTTAASKLWNEHSQLRTEGPHRAPRFLTTDIDNIFACGKTIAFINLIDPAHVKQIYDPSGHNGLSSKIQSVISDRDLPFPVAFCNTLRDHLTIVLASRTSVLRQLLDSRCGMKKTLDALEYTYLRKDGHIPDTYEYKIFSRIDGCMDNWNDRFIVTDMLERLYRNQDCIDVDSITVRSTHTSSRSMESRRRSVRILSSLSIDYTIPWPVANIISNTALAGYRRIALQLRQIRRAKYILERYAYFHAHHTPLGSDNHANDRLFAQTMAFTLIQFVNTLYDHFTTTVIQPRTTKMRRDLSAAPSVDAMIDVHKEYIMKLEFACLTSKQLQVLRDTLIALLDMCIRFADLLSSANASANTKSRRRGSDSDDLESGSFRSARSHHRRRGKAADSGGDDDDDDDDEEDNDIEMGGEGYSSFIVLGEETSIGQEIRKLQTQFKRQLEFFTAGSRGAGRSSGGTVEEFEILAERLEWRGRT